MLATVRVLFGVGDLLYTPPVGLSARKLEENLLKAVAPLDLLISNNIQKGQSSNSAIRLDHDARHHGDVPVHAIEDTK
jgi:hypothetical protein